MMFYKQLNAQGQQRLLQSLSDYAEEILLQDSSKLCYQLAYDNVYQLCKYEKQDKVLQVIYGSIRRVLPKTFSSLNPQSPNFLLQVAALIKKTQRNLQTIKDVCLFLDLNYFKRQLGEELINKLNEIFLRQFFAGDQVLQALGQKIAHQHLKDNQSNIRLVLQVIKTIDQDEQYFVNNFVRFYMPILIQHYTQQAQAQFSEHNASKSIELYVQYAYGQLQKQSQFLNRFWSANKRCAPNKAFIIKQLYEILVSKYKQQIYSNHKQKLFNQLTLQVLQLFKFGVKSNDIQKHADWYNVQIKQKLQTFSNQVNVDFIDQICDFYKKIMNLLEKTHNKFDIHYRSRFAFEQWINTQKLQMPLRLNQYIKEFCIRGQNTKQDDQEVLQRISVIFILMKEKNVFEKYYRRELIHRILNNFQHHAIDKQMRIIRLMQRQCSQQFVKKIIPIVESYQSQAHNKKLNKLNTFFIDIQNWPYEQKNTSISMSKEMIFLTEKHRANFVQSHKDKNLYWHPIIGVVKVHMRFLESKWQGQLTVNTCMANILLNFLKTSYNSFELKTFCCQTGYKLDQLYDSVRRLLHTKIILNTGNEQNYKLAINEAFTSHQDTFDALNVDVVNKFEAKPLEELKADRKFMVQAIIVKIMKKLKHSDKETILRETSPLIQKRGFNFNAKFVQNAIQRLIDKEFIRDFEDGKLGYIA